jgi:hypothetical protein
VHPGVGVEEVRGRTGFPLLTDGGEPARTRLPTDDELRLVREVIDPRRLRDAEVAP